MKTPSVNGITSALAAAIGCARCIRAEDVGEELLKLGAGESARFMLTAFPTLEGSEVDAPTRGRGLLGEVEFFARFLEPFGDGHGGGFWLLPLLPLWIFPGVDCIAVFVDGYAVDSPSSLIAGTGT